ncbi:MAG TPA: WD40 repeat domain-containing protein [Gemmataceae bacterium]|nr:WD40 repeat domain-containing protein [Gemmataceae bacterium]
MTLRETATSKAWPEFTFTSTGESYGNNVALSPNGERAAYVAGPGTVHVWDPTTGKAVAKFEHPKADARDERYLVPTFSTDGRTLFVSTSGTGAIRRYDLESEKELPELTGHLWWVTGVHPLPNGRHLVSASWDGRARRYDLKTGKEQPVPDGYDRGASIAGTADGKLFAVAGWNGRLDLFDQTGRLVRNLQTAGTPLQRIAFSLDGQRLAAYDHGGKVRLWNAVDGTEFASLALPPAGDRRYASALTFSPDGKRLLAAARDDALRCWDLETRKEVWSQATKSDAAAVFTPDGRVLLTGGWDETLTWRDPGAGGAGRRVAVATATGQTGGMNVNSIAFAHDGRTFLTTHHDFAVRRWDTESGKLLDTWKGHRDVTWWAKFSPDGKWAASGSVDKSVRVWDVATGTELARLDGHDAWVMDGVWGANGSTLLTTAGSDVLLWSLRPPDLKAPADVPSLWDDLAAEPAKGYRAQWALIADARAAAKLFRERQGPEKAPGDAAHIRRLIVDLDSDTFRTREQAMKALRDLGKPVVPYLRAAREKASAEAGKRLGELIAEFTQAPTANDLRQMRAVQVLELAGTPEAKAVLTEWAAGQPGVLLTDQAADALRRLGARRD